MKVSPINRESHIVKERKKMHCNAELLEDRRHRLSASVENKFKKSSFVNKMKYSKVTNLMQMDGINLSKHQTPTKDRKLMSIRDTFTVIPIKRFSISSKQSKSSANHNQQRKSKKLIKFQPRAWIISSADVKTAFTPDQNNRLPVKETSSPILLSSLSNAPIPSLKLDVPQNNISIPDDFRQRSKLKIDRPTTHKQRALLNSTYQQKVQALLFPASVNKQKNDRKEIQHLASKYDQRLQKVRITLKEYRERKLTMGPYQQPAKVNRLNMSSSSLVIDVPSRKLDVTTTRKLPAKRSYYDDAMEMLSPQKKRKLE